MCCMALSIAEESKCFTVVNKYSIISDSLVLHAITLRSLDCRYYLFYQT